MYLHSHNAHTVPRAFQMQPYEPMEELKNRLHFSVFLLLPANIRFWDTTNSYCCDKILDKGNITEAGLSWLTVLGDTVCHGRVKGSVSVAGHIMFTVRMPRDMCAGVVEPCHQV